MIIITVYQKRDLSTNKNFLQDKLFTGQMYNFVYKRDLLRAFPTKIRITEVYKNDLFFFIIIAVLQITTFHIKKFRYENCRSY